MNLKRFVIFALMLCLIIGLCACGNTASNDKETTADTKETTEATQGTTEATDDDKVTYTVTVVDEGGNPIANAGVQLCKETCLPGMTNAEGFAEFIVVEDDYKVSFMAMPEGYAADAEEFYFEDGSFDLTITLKAVA